MSALVNVCSFAWLIGAAPLVWCLLFVLLPLAIMLVMSFWTYGFFNVIPDWTLANYRHFFTDGAILFATLRTFVIALCSSLLSVMLAYPIAYFLAFKTDRWRNALLLLVIIPFWTGYLVRVYAWMTVLGERGPLNELIELIFGPGTGLPILYTPLAVVLISTYVFIPFAVVIIYASLANISTSVIDAGFDLGASPARNFLSVTFPLSLAGLRAAWLFTFLPVLGLYATPVLVGGPRSMMIGNMTVPILQEALNYPLGSAIILCVLALTGLFLYLFGRGINIQEVYAGGVGRKGRPSEVMRRHSPALLVYVYAFYALLYVPIAVLVIFSFNDSPSTSLPFTGFTLRWYADIAAASWIQRAVLNSFIVAGLATAIAVVLATAATYVLTRTNLFIKRLLYGALIVPLLVPSLFMAMALLTMFFQFGVVLSMTTIIVGHVTRVLPFVFLSLMAQQAGFDRRVEEAAMDLGASPWQVFWRVTLPSMMPGIIAGALFAFTLSLDEFNMSFLLTGVDTTIPVYMWGMLRTTLSPNINALSTAFIMVSVGLVLVGQGISAARRARLEKARQSKPPLQGEGRPAIA